MHADMFRARDALPCLRVSAWTTLLPHFPTVQVIQILFVHFSKA